MGIRELYAGEGYYLRHLRQIESIEYLKFSMGFRDDDFDEVDAENSEKLPRVGRSRKAPITLRQLFEKRALIGGVWNEGVLGVFFRVVI